MAVNELEDLFISKLSEKFKLMDRDLQRAFKKFDQDGSGFLDCSEMYNAVSSFLNGIDRSLINELVEKYDIDGDGSISLNEFIASLLKKSNGEQISTPSLMHRRSHSFSSRISKASDVSSLFKTKPDSKINEFMIDTSNSVEYQARIYLRNLKATLLRIATDARFEKKIPLLTRLSSHLNPLAEAIGREIMAKEFEPYLRSSSMGVDYATFARVMVKYSYPGASPPSEDMLQYLFSLCCTSESSSDRCNPDILIDLLFSKSSTEINQFGFIQPVVAATDVRRPEVGKGPFTKRADNQVDMGNIPKRMITKHSHTGLAVPSNFDMNQYDRSSSQPNYNIHRDYCIGMNVHPSSGKVIHMIPSSASNQWMVFGAGKLLIMYDTLSSQQIYLEGHTNDVCCIAVSQHYQYIASGQLASKSCCIIIWRLPTASDLGGSGNYMIAKIGEKFFDKGVCSVAFTFNNQYICGINMDDKHSLGIWDIKSGDLIITTSASNGIPPQILNMKFSSNYVNTSYISKDHLNRDCHLLVMCGPRLLKFWSYLLPSKQTSKGKFDPSQHLSVRSFTLGKTSVDAPKVFLSFDMILNRDMSCGVIAGGDNGILYLFEQTVCSKALKLFPSDSGIAINDIIINKTTVYCGCGKGVVAIVDGVNFSVIQTINTTFSAPIIVAESIGGFKGPLSSSSSIKSKSRAMSAQKSRSISKSSSSSAMKSQTAAGAPSRPSSAVRGTRRIPVKDNITAIGDVPPTPPSDGIQGTADILGIGLIFDEESNSVRSIMAATNYGKLISIDMSSPGVVDTVFYYHYGPLYALATITSRRDSIFHSFFVTGGDDKWLNIWSNRSKDLIIRSKTRNAIRAVDVGSGSITSQSTTLGSVCIAVGTTYGYVIIYILSMINRKYTDNRRRSIERIENNIFGSMKIAKKNVQTIGDYTLSQVIETRDSMKDISDVKYNREGTILAVGSHDNSIYL